MGTINSQATRVPDSKKPGDGRATYLEAKEARLWKNIRTAAKTNLALQDVLDHAILIYKLSKKQ